MSQSSQVEASLKEDYFYSKEGGWYAESQSSQVEASLKDHARLSQGLVPERWVSILSSRGKSERPGRRILPNA